ncbi:gliding motility-associated-like protein [Mariniflexile fucanivorans]|uniref:Gliding motility-associated-like protein n=1 Tax=Mariniflexile fucanivorans TaxID=264023 RepID=A0A4R1RP81_9FLAO|nr:T9SS type B sorting domain-containing protein [Mariniflexile fucanivorans]TCL67682.1 gliding motility-associated-like protein [Mariniflexile fucanivorans]
MTKKTSIKIYILLFFSLFFSTTKSYSSILLDTTPLAATWRTDISERCLVDSFTLEDVIIAPTCTTLTMPLAGAIHVVKETNLSWNPVSNVTGYKLTVGTSSGGTDILNAYNVGDVLSYNLPKDLPENATIYVKITPYNSDGDAVSCAEETFITQDLSLVPNCTSLLVPLAGAKNVPIETNLSWMPVPDATGYILTVETFTTGTDIRNTFDVGNITTYDIPANLPQNTTMYITIVPYNLSGEAMGCPEQRFFTGVDESHLPPKFFTPNNDNTNDYWIVPNTLNLVSRVFIYDRYGKLLKQLDDFSTGWDGTFNGNPMPTNDYWYLIVYKNGMKFRGHFSLVR